MKNLFSTSEFREPLKAVGLAFLFGPLGLMYANVGLGLVFIPILFTSIYFGGAFWGVVTHIGGILIAGLFTAYNNEKLELSSTATPKPEHNSAPAAAQSGESLVSIGGARGSAQSAVLVRCPTCNAEISSKALSCPRCGHPISVVSQDSTSVDRILGTTALAQRIAAAVSDGAKVEGRTDSMAVLVYGEPVNHVLHLLLGVFTCGLWWLVWGILGARASARHRRVLVRVEATGALREERIDIPKWRRMSFGTLLVVGIFLGVPLICVVSSGDHTASSRSPMTMAATNHPSADRPSAGGDNTEKPGAGRASGLTAPSTERWNGPAKWVEDFKKILRNPRAIKAFSRTRDGDGELAIYDFKTFKPGAHGVMARIDGRPNAWRWQFSAEGTNPAELVGFEQLERLVEFEKGETWYRVKSGEFENHYVGVKPAYLPKSALLTIETADYARIQNDTALQPWLCSQGRIPGAYPIADGELIATCQELVRQNLRAPSTAEFPGLLDGLETPSFFGNCNEEWKSWVEAKNAFGVPIRTSFTCAYDARRKNVRVRLQR